MRFDDSAKERATRWKSSSVFIIGGCILVVLHSIQNVGTFRPNHYIDINADNNNTSSSTVSPPWQPKSQARQCTRDKTLLDSNETLFKSQDAEDKLLLKHFFHGLCQGTYLEMGGLDGVLFSNSHVFHHALDWKGVLIEASPRNYAALERNRPRDIATIHAGVCATPAQLHWVDAKNARAVGGFQEFAAASFQQRYWTEEDRANAKVVDCLPLSTLLEKAVGTHFYFDFFSLDVEGSEFAVLQSIDFTHTSFGVIFVEADGHNARKNLAIRYLLESKGYRYYMDKGRSLWFVNQDFATIYEDLIYPIEEE